MEIKKLEATESTGRIIELGDFRLEFKRDRLEIRDIKDNTLLDHTSCW